MKGTPALIAFCLAAASVAAEPPESIQLILDASGSMNAPLEDKQTRLAAARTAVRAFLGGLPPGTALAFRAYGHQSPREKKDCNDTTLLVPFVPLAEAREKVGGMLDGIKAQGYTPITKSLALAAKDFTAGPSRMILLVSDGKETCGGDPCLMARELKKANAGLVIHTVGLGVDRAAEFELACVAAATGGEYFPAADTGRLQAALQRAAGTGPKAVVEKEKEGGGILKVVPAGPKENRVVDAFSGAEVAVLTPVNTWARVPAGTYRVSFGTQSWNGVVVRTGQTTTLEPARIDIRPLNMSGAVLQDPETGAELAKLTAINTWVTVLPGVYHVWFGKHARYPYVKLDSGKPVTLQPGKVKLASVKTPATILAASGEEIARLDAVNTWTPLPPGTYKVQVQGGAARELVLREGETTEVPAP
jgi:hypothetical protein